MKWMDRLWALLVLAVAAVLGALLCGRIVGAKQVQTVMLLAAMAALLVLAGTLHRGRSCCIHRIARCSLLGLRGTAALRLAVLGLWFFRCCLRGAGRGGRRTGFAVLVIIICARGTAGVIAAALLAGAFFVVVIFHCITSILYSARVGGYTHGKHRTPDVMFCRM